MMEIANNDNFMYYIYFYYIRISMKLIHINMHITILITHPTLSIVLGSPPPQSSQHRTLRLPQLRWNAQK